MDKIYTLIASFYTGMYDRDESEDAVPAWSSTPCWSHSSGSF